MPVNGYIVGSEVGLAGGLRRGLGPSHRVVTPPLLRFNSASRVLTGLYRLAGQLPTGGVAIEATPADIPVSRRILLIDRVTGQYVTETRSLADGSFEFRGLARREYIAMADDDVDDAFHPAAVICPLPVL